MKVKISPEWFREKIIRNETGEVREQREYEYRILEEHGFICEFQFEVRARGSNELLGVRVGLFDPRLYRNKLYMTPSVGNYEIIEQ